MYFVNTVRLVQSSHKFPNQIMCRIDFVAAHTSNPIVINDYISQQRIIIAVAFTTDCA